MVISAISRGAVSALVAISIGAVLSGEPSGLPDFARLRDEAVQIEQALIRLDSSNPPGNETRVAEHVRGILEREGIPAKIFTLEPGRGSLVARLRGSGRKRPLLLMGHTDVVGVERDKWTVDPFAAVIKDGYLYGRGAMDDKDSVASALVVMLTLHRLKIPLDRDVILLAEAGEEATSNVGIGFMVDQHWDEIACEFALGEGGSVPMRGGVVRYMGVATTEKLPRRLKLVARGTSGHGAVPRLDNPITHLAAAVARLGTFQAPARLNETTRTFFQRMAALSPPEEAFLLTHLEDATIGPMVQEVVRNTLPRFNSMLRTSIVPTMIGGGFRSTVIPAEAEATFDVRTLPDEDMDQFVAMLTRLIDDPAVEIVRLPAIRPAAPPSRLDTEMFRAMERAQAVVYPGAVTIPMMLAGATDSSQLRAKGVQAYGIAAPGDEQDPTSHGNDERISIEGLGKMIEVMYRTVVDVAAAPRRP